MGISNGIAFDKDNKKMFFADSLVNETYVFDYDENKRDITNQKIIHRFGDKTKTPDGGTITSDDKYLSAIWGGSCVRVYDINDNYPLKKIINTPAKYTTCCCVGGKYMNKLFVTSAKEDDSSKDAGKSFIFDLKKSVGIGETPVNY